MPTAAAMKLAVLGCPVEHSLSPAMHSAAIRAMRLDAVYLACHVEPEDLVSAVRGLRALGFRGANVTIPHKFGAAALCDILEPSAVVAGGANTLIFDDDALRGASTDGEGLRRALAEDGIPLAGKRVVLAGAGGSARAIASALLPEVASIHVAARRVEAAEALRGEVAGGASGAITCGGLDADELAEAVSESDILINATPLGMWPRVEGCLPIDPRVLVRRLTVVDIVPNPLRTRLMVLAERAGCRVVGGLGMLVHQGAVSLEMWTGVPAPVAVMREACVEALRAFR